MSTIVVEDNAVGYLRLQQYPPLGLIVHLDMHQWSLKVYKETLQYFSQLTQDLSRWGINELYATIEPGREGIMKFAELYGFEETDIVLENEKGEPACKVWKYEWEIENGS